MAMILAACSGCGYVVGNPYGPEVRTVHVPTFKNETYRQGYELELTEAVQKQIQLRTPYQLAKEPGADTRLVGRIVSINKRVENQNKYDDPRELELAIGIEVRWEDVRSGQVLAERVMPVDVKLAHAIANASFAPETGQSLATARQDAMDQLARQIVGLMEAPW
jgi:hypothetical protein